MRLGRVRVLAGLSLTVFLVCVLTTVGSVWAFTVNGGTPPIAGQPFTITGTSAGGPIGAWDVFSDAGCTIIVGANTGLDSTGPYTDHITALPAGTYYFLHELDPSADCVAFTVDPAPTPSYIPPVTIGGTMLPINRFLILLPWLTLIVILSTVAAYTLTTTRKTTKRK